MIANDNRLRIGDTHAVRRGVGELLDENVSFATSHPLLLANSNPANGLCKMRVAGPWRPEETRDVAHDHGVGPRPSAVSTSRLSDARAPEGADPFAKDPDAVAVGFDHYRENCVICHGAPGVEAGELAKGLNPPAPHLWDVDGHIMPDGQTFWAIKHGIRMTGMPAFGPTHTDEEIWKIVAFLHHLNALSAEQKQRLQAVTAEDEHHHDDGDETEHPTSGDTHAEEHNDGDR